jgi:hypothetical protein
MQETRPFPRLLAIVPGFVIGILWIALATAALYSAARGYAHDRSDFGSVATCSKTAASRVVSTPRSAAAATGRPSGPASGPKLTRASELRNPHAASAVAAVSTATPAVTRLTTVHRVAAKL